MEKSSRFALFVGGGRKRFEIFLKKFFEKIGVVSSSFLIFFFGMERFFAAFGAEYHRKQAKMHNGRVKRKRSFVGDAREKKGLKKIFKKSEKISKKGLTF